MSLINKVLQDLEARQDTAPRAKTPVYQNLRPIKSDGSRGPKRLLLAVVAVLVVGAGIYGVSRQTGIFAGILPPGFGSATPVEAARPQTPTMARTQPATAPAPPAVSEDSQEKAPKPTASISPAVVEPTPVPTVTPGVQSAVPAPPVVPSSTAGSQNAAQVGIVMQTKTPASMHKGERKSVEAKLPRTGKTVVAASAPQNVAVVDKKVRPLTADEQAEASYRRAVRYLDQGRPQDAMRQLRDALVMQPKHVKARELAAGIALQSGHWREAQGLLEEGLRQVPSQYLFARLLARVYVDHGAEAKALAVMESAAPQGSDDAEFSALLGLLYQRAGRHADAVTTYERALALNPAESRTWLGFAISLESEGRTGAAKTAYRRATQGGLPPTLARYAEQRLAELKDD